MNCSPLRECESQPVVSDARDTLLCGASQRRAGLRPSGRRLCRPVLVSAGAALALLALPRASLAVQACPDPGSCAQVSVEGGSGRPGGTVSVSVTFKQGPDNGQPGGIDENAALALTLSIGASGTTPLTLADCTLDDDGLPGAVKRHPSLSNYKLVVENASCANGRTHCLCPDAGSGISPDNFINMVIYGPDPLPTPGPTGIDVPTLPSGPPPFVTIDLKIVAGTPAGSIPLHVYNEVKDTDRPQYTAFLSVGDKNAVDQTCVPVTGQIPCGSGDSVSQVDISDGTVEVGKACVGDCDGTGAVTVNELVTMVNIALGNQQLSACVAGNEDGNGEITINEIITAVNNALNGCR